MKRSHGSMFPTILLGGVIYTYWDYAKYVLVVIILTFTIRLAIKLVRKIRTISHDLLLRDVDGMDGAVFEHYFAQLLINCGYTNVSLTERYDYGVDIIAEKDGIRWVFK